MIKLEINVIDLLFDLWTQIKTYAVDLTSWLFEPVTIAGYTFVPLFAVGGGTLIVLMVMYIIKNVAPFL